MPENVRAIIVVLVLAAPALYLARRITAEILTPHEFAVLRNGWVAVTLVSFFCGNFAVFSVMVLLICIYVYQVRSAVIPFFFIALFSVPLVNIPIGGLGLVNTLLDANNGRLLAMLLLLPMLIVPRGGPKTRVFAMPDRFIIFYALLMTMLQFRAAEFTHVLRTGTALTLDVLIPYFAFSRVATTFDDIRKALAAFIMVTLPLAVIALFEALKGWRLYSAAAEQLGGGGLGYLTREGMLRASVTALSPIVLGLMVMVAMGCLLAVWQKVQAKQFAGIGMVVLIAALLATLSRGPWVGAAVLFLAYFATGPNAAKKIALIGAVGGVALIVLMLSPAGERLSELMPLSGAAEAETVNYRQRLFDSALIVIDRNFWLGSVDYNSAPEMEEMVQGEGIIDIVNSYLKIALDAGIVGLAAFFSFFAGILLGLWRSIKGTADIETRSLMRAGLAVLLGILVTLATVSSIDFVPYVYWSFAGLCVAMVRISARERPVARSVVQAQRVAG